MASQDSQDPSLGSESTVNQEQSVQHQPIPYEEYLAEMVIVGDIIQGMDAEVEYLRRENRQLEKMYYEFRDLVWTDHIRVRELEGELGRIKGEMQQLRVQLQEAQRLAGIPMESTGEGHKDSEEKERESESDPSKEKEE